MQGGNQPKKYNVDDGCKSPFCDPVVALHYLHNIGYHSVAEVRSDYHRALSAWYRKNGK